MVDEIEKGYRECIPAIVKSLELTNANISFVFDEKIYGGKIIKITSPKIKNELFVDAKILFGKQTQVYHDLTGYIFHELSHLIHFSYMMIDNNFEEYDELLFFFSENPHLIPLSEVVADTITGIKGNLKEEILKREFVTWKWWNSLDAFRFAKKETYEYCLRLQDKSVQEIISYFIKNKEPVEMSKKLYSMMKK